MELAEKKGVRILQGSTRDDVLAVVYWHDLQRDLDSWTDSQIRKWVLKNGIPLPQDLKRDELLAIVYKLQQALTDGFSGIDGLPRTHNGMKVLGHGNVNLKTWSKETGTQIFSLDNVLYIPDAQQSRISVGELYGKSPIHFEGDKFKSIARFSSLTAVLKNGVYSVDATVASMEETLKFTLSGYEEEKQKCQGC